jgi:hypothetical protein
VWLDFAATHKHLVIDVTITTARTISNVQIVGAPLPLPRRVAIGRAQQAELDYDLCTLSSRGTPPMTQYGHDYYLFALEEWGRWAPMAVDLVDRLAILAVFLRFPSMSAADSRSLVS